MADAKEVLRQMTLQAAALINRDAMQSRRLDGVVKFWRLAADPLGWEAVYQAVTQLVDRVNPAERVRFQRMVSVLKSLDISDTSDPYYFVGQSGPVTTGMDPNRVTTVTHGRPTGELPEQRDYETEGTGFIPEAPSAEVGTG